MPAQRTYYAERGDKGEEVLAIRIEGDLEQTTHRKKRKLVYFTDQSPCFTIVAENISDQIIDTPLNVQISYDASENRFESGEFEGIDVELEPGEKRRYERSVDLLAYQGTAAISIRKIRLRMKDGQLKQLTRGRDPYHLYTFMVYDRDYYKVNYQTPRYAQYISAGLAVIIILVGVVQILL